MTGGWPVGPTLIGAVALAVEDVNNNPDLLKGKRLEYVWADDGCNRQMSLVGFIDMLGTGPRVIDGLIGPGCAKGCEVTQTLARAKNIPQISATCASPSLSNKDEFPLFVRTTSPYAKWAAAIVSIMKAENWTRLSVVNDVAMAASVGALRAELVKEKLKFGADVQFDADRFTVKPGEPSRMVAILDAGVRVVMVYAFAADNVAIAVEARTQGMAAGWAFMGLDMVFGCEEGLTGAALKTAQEALHGWIFFEPSSTAVQSFFDRVRAASISVFGQKLEADASINLYAANLYDAVMLYARVASLHLNELSDGQVMVDEMRKVTFDGMTGKVAIDQNGDMKESIRAMNYVKLPNHEKMRSSLVGVFDGLTRQYAAVPNAAVIWPGGSQVPPISWLACDVGMYLVDQKRCVPCRAGTVSPGGTVTACLNCPAGTGSSS